MTVVESLPLSDHLRLVQAAVAEAPFGVVVAVGEDPITAPVVFVNDRARQLLGSDVAGQPLFLVSPPPRLSQVSAAGSTYWIGTLASGGDIAARFLDWLSRSHEATFLFDRKGRTVLTGGKGLALLGYEPAEVLGLSAARVIHPDDLARHADRMAVVLRRPGAHAPFELRARHQDGSWRLLRCTAHNLLDEPGIEAVVCTIQDITEHQRVQERLAASESLFEAVVRHASDVITVVAPDGRIQYANQAAVEMLGYSELDEITNVFEIVHPDDVEAVAAAAADLIAGHSPAGPIRYRLRRQDGVYRHFESVTTNLLDVPQIEGVLVLSRDVDERTRAERRLAGQARILEMVARGAALAETVTALCQFLGEHDITATFHRSDVTTGLHRAVVSASNGHRLGTFVIESGDPADPAIDDAVHLAAIAVERSLSQEELAHQALHDPLTDLPHRTLFLDRLTVALERLSRGRTPLAVMFIDLDRFKAVNDGFGHEVGDQVLVTIARRLVLALRPGDTVARFGGDEFTVCCEEVGEPDEAVEIARRLVAAVNEPIAVAGVEVTVRASVGVALAGAAVASAAELVADADVAMYRAKRHGGGCSVFEPAMRAGSTARLQGEAQLRRALSAAEFHLVYQPRFTLAGGAVTMAEALVRWHHHQRGLLRPAEFLPLAVEAGLMADLDRLVLEAACQQAAEWRAAGVGVVVNVSARRLADRGFADEVAAVISAVGLEPAQLWFDISESILTEVEDEAGAAGPLHRLADLGVRICLDDFGTGAASLIHLRQAPVHAIAIDRGFVQAMDRHPADAAVVRGVVHLAHDLGRLTVAKGVERPAQLAGLAEAGTDLAQGYLLGRPAPADELLRRG